ncbi:NAD-dependent epimerase/dehydratase family protein, partial [Bacillus pumilus]|uniref:NAD-dependent epimerase/dehydratase family protein n=1 Tax=Bacillus pumilus TaxID=1408 RepID=UPI0034D97759
MPTHPLPPLLPKPQRLLLLHNFHTPHKQPLFQPPLLHQLHLPHHLFLTQLFKTHQIQPLIHFPPDSLLPHTLTHPLNYYHNNLAGPTALLQLMDEFDLKHIVFS